MTSGNPSAGEPSLDRVTAIEGEWRQTVHKNRLWTFGWLVLASIILLGSVELSAVGKSSVDAGWIDRIASFVDRLIPDLKASSLFEGREVEGSLASWFYDLPHWLEAMRETVAMAFVGTVIGGLLALCLSFYAAANLNKNALLRHVVRRGFDAARTIPDVILALIFAAAFSLGAVAGVLTIIITTMGSLGKLFSECMENVEMSQVDAIEAVGGHRLLQLRFGILPQLLPQILSYWLLRLEINLSVAAALGIVGAGGIGMELERAISFTEFDTYLAILILIVFCIFVIDLVSENVRHRLIGLAK